MRGAALLLSLALCSCATSYGPKGINGGVSEVQLDEVTYRITAQGNGWTGLDQVQNFVLLRAAELARSRGYSHFAVSGEDTNVDRRMFSTGGTQYVPLQLHTVQLPSHSAVVRLQNGKGGAGLVMDAAIVFSSLAPKVMK